MKKEIKIVISYDDDFVGNNCSNTHVYLNDKQIGLIQNISINADVNRNIPEVNFTFPDLNDLKDEDLFNKNLKQTLEETIRNLSSLTNVSLSFRELK